MSTQKVNYNTKKTLYDSQLIIEDIINRVGDLHNFADENLPEDKGRDELFENAIEDIKKIRRYINNEK